MIEEPQTQYSFDAVNSWHGVSSEAVDGGEGLQIWSVAASILNKEWHIADRGWSCSML
jgi:hypothetical protein